MTNLPVKTQHLVIRNLCDSDLEAFHRYRSDPEITKYQGFETMSREAAEIFIQEQKNKTFGIPGEWVQYAIELFSKGELIGDCAIKLQESDPGIAEIGITISGTEQQKGYGRETMDGLLHFLFRGNNIRRVVETVDVKNTASIALLENLSFRKEGHFIDHVFLKGEWCSEFQYAMLKSEWEMLQGEV